jgi:hypothetical protein
MALGRVALLAVALATAFAVGLAGGEHVVTFIAGGSA